MLTCSFPVIKYNGVIENFGNDFKNLDSFIVLLRNGVEICLGTNDVALASEEGETHAYWITDS